ncbi:MAG TPA: transglycosylase domain-containing protein [Baekduia sp.]|uniref:transglycosylase domain-containing protein n=1 Tax=Baekduia sp. TaxID=2600305 RepID=UPI002D021ED5|nr:transglycosylase domain-containing protein [Baekduia sp.]HMJ32409.1 transglycosylase domain-containing protein [Baekduia sp.]
MADDDALSVRRESRRRRARHRGHGVVIGVALVVIMGGTAAAGLVMVARSPQSLIGCHLASTRPRVVGQDTFLFAADGSRLGAVPTSQNREPVTLDRMSRWLPVATVSIEDRRFWSHGALDYAGIGRAALADLEAGQVVQGGSTLTQQLVRTRYLGGENMKLSRKLTEACLAVELARVWSRRRILATYLNTVFYGHHAFGVEAAARTYFSRPASHLSLVQAAVLAGLPQAPSRNDPLRHPVAAMMRRNEVLAAMRRQGVISESRYRVAAAARLRLRPSNRYSRVRFKTFFDTARRELDRRYGSARVRHGGLHVRTTLDPRLQRLAGRAIGGWIHRASDPAAVLVAIDPGSGAIRAMATAASGHPRLRFNLATQSHRQAGSAFKMFTLTTALEQGIPLSSVWNGPSSLTIPDRRCMNAEGPWVVHNFADEATGTMDLLQAIAHSVNTIFAQVALRVGPQNIVRTARRMGIRSPLKAVCAITLGPEGVSPLEMTDAFATLASGGVHHTAEALDRVVTADGAVRPRRSATGSRVLTPGVARSVTYALTGVIRGGTGTAADPGRPAAGKTGTAEDFKDAWFCGFVPQLVACVWIGYPGAETPMASLDGFAQVVGGSVPARIWHDFMVPAMAGRPVVPLRGVNASHVALRSPNLTGGTGPAPPAAPGQPQPVAPPLLAPSPPPAHAPASTPPPGM